MNHSRGRGNTGAGLRRTESCRKDIFKNYFQIVVVFRDLQTKVRPDSESPAAELLDLHGISKAWGFSLVRCWVRATSPALPDAGSWTVHLCRWEAT